MSKRRAKLTVFLSKNIMRLMLRQAFFFFFLIVVAGSRNEKSVTSANKAVCMWQPMHTGQEVSAKNFIQPFCLMCTCEVRRADVGVSSSCSCRVSTWRRAALPRTAFHLVLTVG